MLEQFEGNRRANLTRQVGAEDPMSELERFFKSARHQPTAQQASEPILPAPSPADGPRPSQQPHVETRQPTTDGVDDRASDRQGVVEARPSDLRHPVGEEQDLATGSTHFVWRGWKVIVLGVVCGVVTVISAGFALKHTLPGPPPSSLFVDATARQIGLRPSNDEAIPTLRNVGDSTWKDVSPPTHLQGGNLATKAEESGAVAKSSSAPNVASVDGSGTAAEVSSVAAVATTTIDASAVTNLPAPPPLAFSQTAGLGPVRNAEPIVGGTVRAKSTAREEASVPTPQPEGPSAKATSPSNAPTLPIASDQHGGDVAWSVQLAAAKSETQAESDATRLEARYKSALSGRRIGVQKAVVGDGSIYRARVVGLSKADARAFCAHVKRDGGECFIAK